MALVSKTILKGEQGQAVTEYILMIAVVVTIYLAVAAQMNKLKLQDIITKPITGPFAAAYRYGHTQGKGYDDGGPLNHPRAETGENCFRIFFNSLGGQ